jgi:predicted nucleotidyltransferase
MSDKTINPKLAANELEKLIYELLWNRNSVLFGSRRLGLHSEDSDYDIAVAYNDVPIEVFTKGKMRRPNSYHRSILFDRCALWEIGKLQVFVCPDTETLEMIDNAMSTLIFQDQKILSDKLVRVSRFRQALMEEGWYEEK